MTEPASGFERYTRSKGWKHMVLGAGYELASALTNDMQRVERDNITQVLNVLLAEKAVLKGCELIFIDATHITISPGQVLVDGIVHDVGEQEIVISGSGSESIGLRVTKVVKDYNDDVDLLDPAEGFAGYGAPYARAETYTTTWVINDAEAVAFFDVRDGVLQLYIPPPQTNGINEILARRTYDENNHFRVSGLAASIKEKDNNNMLLKVESGKAYVMGFEVIKPGDTNITVSKAITALPIANEYHTFVGGTNLYALGTTPVKQVIQATANIQITDEVVLRNNYPPTITDQLLKTNVTKILSVTQDGNPASPFIEGTDFVLTNNAVDWTLSLSGGDRPANGSTYKVTYLYQKVLVLGVRVKTDVVESITKGSANGQDNLAHGDIIEETVVVTKGATTYSKTTDYLVVKAKGVTTGGKIDWSPGGTEPTTSESYTVSYSYWAHSTEGDYTAYNSYDELIYAPDRNFIDFTPSGDNPYGTAPYNTFSVSYDYYIPRRDVIVIDKNGNIMVLQGEPKYYDPKPPLVPGDVLGLHEIRFPPDSTNVRIIEFDNLVVQQPELQQLRRRVSNLEFDLGQKDLDQGAKTRLPGQALKGLWTDNFTDIEKADWFYENFDVLYSIPDGVISLPRELFQFDPTLNTGSTTAKINKTLLSLQYTNVPIVSQPFASEAINVNPYDVFGLRPNIALDPDQDIAPGDIRLSLGGNMPVSGGQIPRFLFAWEEWWVTFKQTLPQDLPGLNSTFQEFLALSGAAPAVQSTILANPVTTPTISILNTITSNNGASLIIRQKPVTISGDRYTPNANNLAATFDGVPVSLTPVAPTSLEGTTPGTIRANAAGEAAGLFTIPANMYGIGGKVVTLGNDFESASAIYMASYSRGIRLAFTMNWFNIDPISQSFLLSESRVLTGIRLWFKEKSSVQPIQVLLRTTRENGEPGDRVIAIAKVKAVDVNISDDATLSTDFLFEDPVIAEPGVMYAYTVFSPSNEYEVWVGRGGYYDIPTNQPIKVNPYGPGVLFLSANNRTWTPDQAADMKFQLLAAKFNPTTAVARWNNLSPVSMTSFTLLDQHITPIGTSLLWEYSVDGGTTWLPTTSLQPQGLPQDYSAITLGLRATFTGTGDGWLSPLLHKDLVHFIAYRNKLTGLYTNYNNQLPDPANYDTLKVWFQAFIPSGTTVTAYYSVDGGLNWVELTSPTTTPIDTIWTEYAYSATVTDETDFRFKIGMTTGSAPTQRIIVPMVRRLQSVVY